MDFAAQNVTVKKENGRILFSNGVITLEFDAESGAWLGLFWTECEGNLITPNDNPLAADVCINGEWIVEKYGAKFLRYDTHKQDAPENKAIHLHYSLQNDAYILTIRHSMDVGGSFICREAWIRSKTQENTFDAPRIEAIKLELPGVALGNPADTVVNVPGPFFPKTYIRPNTRYNEQTLRPAVTFHSAPDAGFGVLSLTNTTQNATLVTWMEALEETQWIPGIMPHQNRLTFIFNNRLEQRLRPKGAPSSCSQSIELCKGDFAAATAPYLSENEILLTLDPVTPNWAREMNLLEVFPAYFKDGFKGITAKLAFYREVGFNAIYLMPHWTGPYHGYQPNDLTKIRPEYGTADDLKELTATAHALGMRVLFDMVIHGFDPQSEMLTEHPEYFCHTETGEIALHPTWKSATCDWANPAYREYMAALARHDLTTYDIDGYRVDAASFKGPNWDRNLPYPAYFSGTDSPEVMRSVLNALRQTKSDAMLLSEVFGPVFYKVSNLAHDNQTEANIFLLEKIAKGEANAHDYKLHLANVMDLLQPGALRVVFTRNHDTSWFYHFTGYTPDFFAFEAIHALCLIPEVFAGDPDNGPNPDDDATTWQTYRRLLTTRNHTPEIARGSLHLRDVEADNLNIFTALRRLNDSVVVVIVSLSSQDETAKLSFSNLEITRDIVLKDILTDETFLFNFNNPTLKIKPYQALIGRI